MYRTPRNKQTSSAKDKQASSRSRAAMRNSGQQCSISPAPRESNSTLKKHDPSARYLVFMENVHARVQYAEVLPPRIFGQRYVIDPKDFPSKDDKYILFHILNKYVSNTL